jgi:hypothetical protein
VIDLGTVRPGATIRIPFTSTANRFGSIAFSLFALAVTFAPTRPALSHPAGVDVQVRPGQFMASHAMGLARISCGRTDAVVDDIESSCYGSKVGRIDAATMTADVVNAQTGWDRPFGQLVRVTVRVDAFDPSVDHTQVEVSVASRLDRSGPRPALVWPSALIDLAPEAFFCRFGGLEESSSRWVCSHDSPYFTPINTVTRC